jgi:hypothetical protein
MHAAICYLMLAWPRASRKQFLSRLDAASSAKTSDSHPYRTQLADTSKRIGVANLQADWSVHLFSQSCRWHHSRGVGRRSVRGRYQMATKLRGYQVWHYEHTIYTV